MTKREIIEFAVQNYGFIIPYNTTVTFAEFAELIKSHYDCQSESQNKTIAETMQTTTGTIARTVNTYNAKWA
jgi:hypothetical protein